MEASKTLFWTSKFSWARETVSSKFIDNLDTRLQKGLSALGCSVMTNGERCVHNANFCINVLTYAISATSVRTYSWITGQCFYNFTPFLLRRCSTARDLTIPQLLRYSRTAHTVWHADQNDGTPLHCSHVFDVAWKATPSKRSGSSSCAVERSGKKWHS